VFDAAAEPRELDRISLHGKRLLAVDDDNDYLCILREQAIALFDIDGVGRAPSRMDYAKLAYVNGVWIRSAADDRLTGEVLHFLAGRPGLALGPDAERRICALMPDLKERAKTLVELADAADFLARPLPLPMTPKATALLNAENRLMLRDVAAVLAATDFSPAALDVALRAYGELTGRKLGTVAQPLSDVKFTTNPPEGAV